MNVFYSILIGYLIGSLSPASLLGRRKHVDLSENGTGNLGATNTLVVLGWRSGAVVMVFDVFKSFFSGKLAQLLFPNLRVAGMLACVGAMLGHCFPVFHHFKGGKGLAAFGGLVVYYRLWFVPVVLFSALGLMILLDCAVAFPLFVGVLFPVMVILFGGTWQEIAVAVLAGGLLLLLHIGNLKKALAGDASMHVRAFLKKRLFHGK